MFKLQSQQIFEGSRWVPPRGGLAYLEAVESSMNKTPSSQLLQGYLYDHEVEDWVHQHNKFESGVVPTIRLIFCDRIGWKPLGFAMSGSSYITLEEEFGLGHQVLPLLSKNAGQHYCSLKYASTGDALKSLEFTIKWPQMYQIGNCGFSLRHDFATRRTLCFAHGWDMVVQTDAIPARERFTPYFDEIEKHMRPAKRLWSHPLFLPTVFLAEHLSRANRFRSHLSSRVVELEKELGVTRSATLSWKQENTFEAIQDLIANRQVRMNLTAELNTRITDATNFQVVLTWINEHCQFLEKYKDIVHRLNPHPDKNEHRQLEEYLDFLIDNTKSMNTNVDSLKSRLELQLNVLYNFVAQVDNDLNVRMAYRAGLDGTAMKTLAYVTAIFLPPTFVATVFSMSMFDWQASTGLPDSVVLVPDFWIFWVVSVPLTLAVLVGWRYWLRFEKNTLQSEYNMQQADKQPSYGRRTSTGKGFRQSA
ncbi:hypothetical protein O1611_g430 [Lasiodiplodia mahajangana]|uniref:Uncharacterized protein n=1 Tax=Lasiodiplodia mahajangana TaxID=1108764 RepID=A0ACC2K067_9PEZI|nr:hypothetical protein O1611_g430 [Lasiodiplodia mahajangana]